jgi:hypothetical protein
MYNILERLNDTGNGIYEIVLEDGDMMDLNDLMKLNRAGYVCIKSQFDIDYEDEDENGNITRHVMDIHYFGKVNVKQFTEIMDL